VPRRKRPVMFRLVPDDEHPLAERFWRAVEVEAANHSETLPRVLADLYFDDEPEVSVDLEQAESVQRWCLALDWWPDKGPAPLKWERISAQRGPEPTTPTAKILVSMTVAEREALNAEAKRLGLTQQELARRKLTAPYSVS
jgi:hypothetical protein